MKEKIVLLAHGSSDTNWSDTFFKLTEAACASNDSVDLAFMELSEPSLEACIATASQQGYTRIKVLPLFLAKGRHLKKDVPSMLETYAEKYAVSTELLEPIGHHPRLSDALCNIIEETIA